MTEKDVVATYAMIKAFYNQPSNTWLAISEFIDNSISSWQGKGNPDASLDGLKIDIIYDLRNEDNCKLIIIDNANGMNSEELVTAMQPHNTTGKKDNEYNQYGVGMKFGCFWNGEDATIYSKTKTTQENKVWIKTKHENTDNMAKIICVPSYENKITTQSGTYIEIEYLYENRKPNNQIIQSLKEALGWRYNKLIKDKNMSIYLTVMNGDSKKSIASLKIDPFVIEPWTIDYFFQKKKNDISNFTVFRNSFVEAINCFKENTKKKLPKLFCEYILSGKELIAEVAINVNNPNYSMEFDKYILIENENHKREILQSKKYNAILKFGILSPLKSKYSERSGVTTYHIKRAINHGPNKNIQDTETGTIDFLQANKASGGDPKWRRLYGEIDLTNIEIPDQNKGKFNWSSHGKENLITSLKSVYDDIEELLQILVDFENKKDPKVCSQKDTILKISNSQRKERVYDLDVINTYFLPESEFSNNGSVYYKLKNFDKKIKIVEKSSDDSFLININHMEEDTITAIININSEIWKPFIADKKTDIDFRAKTVYKVVLTLVIANEYINDRAKWKEIFNMLGCNKMCDNLFEIINNILEIIEYKGTSNG